MIDFRNRDLYKRERPRMERFLEEKLITEDEFIEQESNQDMMVDELGMGDIIGGDAFDGANLDDDFGFGDDSVGDFGGAGDRSGVKGDTSWYVDGQPVKTFFFAPVNLVRYVFTDITKDFPKKEEWKNIIKAFNVGNMVSISLAFMELILNINNIFSPVFQLVAGLVMFMITTSILYVVYEEDTYAVQVLKKILGKEDEETGDFTFDDDDSFGDDLTGIMPIGDDEVEDESFDIGLDEDNLIEEVEDDEEEYEEVEEDEYDDYDEERLRDSPIEPRDEEMFKHELLEVFKRGQVNRGKAFDDRMDILHSFSGYLVQNDRKFGTMVRPRERGVEYNNIAYALFKGLSQIERQFGSYGETEEDTDKMVVLDIKKSPILYRIELELPTYFSERKIQNGIKVIEDVLKVAEDDFDVAVIVTTFQGNYVFKLLRFDSPVTTSVGDILRYKDEDRGYVGLESFKDPKVGLPVLFGLQNNEVPYVVDWEENTSGVIVGGSGSGKSWATFMMMLNFVMANDYNNVQFIILDRKNSPFWNSFARFPHVLGYHTELEDYIDVLTEVEEERQRRQKMQVEMGIENIKGYREMLRKEGRHDELKEVPLLFLIIDEITATMLSMKEEDDDLFKLASNIMGQIASQGRSSGVRILGIGQRSTFDSIPKTLMANCSFKFGMRMNVENDFITMFGKDVEKIKYPRQRGLGLSVTEETMGIQNVKTLTVGGNSDNQIQMLIRAMAFEWIRRGHELEDFTKPPKSLNLQHSFNRNKFYDMSLKEMKEGKILNPSIVNRGYEVNLDEEDTVILGDTKEYEEIDESNILEEDEINRNKIEERKQEIDKENILLKEGKDKKEEDKEEGEEESGGEVWLSMLESMEDSESGEIKEQEESEKQLNEDTETGIRTEIKESKELGEEDLDDDVSIDMLVKREMEESKKQDKLENDKKEEVVSLEDILGVSEELGEEPKENSSKKSINGSVKGVEESSVVGDTYVGKGVETWQKGENNLEVGDSEEVHPELHPELHQELPMQVHTILQENYTTIEKDISDSLEEVEIDKSNKQEKDLKAMEEELFPSRELEEDKGLLDDEKEVQQEENKVEELEVKEEKLPKEIEKESEGRKEDKASLLKKLNTVEKAERTEEKREIEFDFVVKEQEDKKEEPGMTVRQYVAKYGQASGFNVFMEKEYLEEVYRYETIENALVRMAIIEKDGYYMTTL